MLGLDPDTPIRLPISRRTLARVGLGAFLLYMLVGCVVVTRDRGRRVDVPPELAGCFAGPDKASACFDATSDGTSLRVSDGERSLVLGLTSWQARRAFEIGSRTNRTYLEVSSIAYANSFGKTVVDEAIKPGDCRLMRVERPGDRSRWSADLDCRNGRARLAGNIIRQDERMIVDLAVNDKTFEMDLKSVKSPSDEDTR